jgi:hypothetical protein
MPQGLRPGLCSSCRNAREIVSARGSRFVLCRLSERDRSFAKYPRLPVVECSGYERTDPPDGSSEEKNGFSGY